MASERWSGLAAAVLLAGVHISCAAWGQVSGEIVVGRTASPLVPGLQTQPGQSPDAPPVRGDLTEPEAIVLPQPLYPRAARAARQEGRVMVCFTLDERGMVRMPAVRTSTNPVFDQPALDAISAARFTPARLGKQAVRSTACRTFQFVLR